MPAPALPTASLDHHWKSDLISGFFVSLIALPLCLGIAMASGYPPIAGVFTAILGGLICPLLSDSQMTIKGPAAGLIVIVVGAVTELGNGDMARGYQLALGVGVVAGIIQIGFGLLRTGVLGEFFPSSAVHGMLAAIGVIIFGKQIHTVLGVTPQAKSPLKLLLEIPHSLIHLHPAIALIGVLSLLILAVWPLLRFSWTKRVPAPLVVLALAIPLGYVFHLEQPHLLQLWGHSHDLGPKFLVDVPANPLTAIQFPDFSAVLTGTGIKYLVMFSLVGTLESLLSAKAVDGLDRFQRRTHLDRDIIAVGVANTLASLIGGLPMISEIVRSSANVNYGGKTRWANFVHGACLLGFIAIMPAVIHRIPLAALGAMLVYTGCRLASPKEFLHTWRVGAEQLSIFLVTLLGVLAIDLLVGIALGIILKFAIHLFRGASFRSLFKPQVEVNREEGVALVTVQQAAIFSNWIPLRRLLMSLDQFPKVVVDLSKTTLVDHTVMEKLHTMQRDYGRQERVLEIQGLESHRAVSEHPTAARVAPSGSMTEIARGPVLHSN